MVRETDDRLNGALLILGSVLGVLVMAVHPTARDITSATDASAAAHRGALIHGVALLAVPMIFIGLLGWSRRLGFSNLAVSAIVVYGFGSVALINAAIADGLVATRIIALSSTATDPSQHELLHQLGHYTGWWNQGFATFSVFADGAAILLWSIAMIRARVAREAGMFGVFVGVALIAGMASGHLVLNVHGYGAVILLQSIWMIWLGVAMMQRPQSA
jgi:hypothetical protein